MYCHREQYINKADQSLFFVQIISLKSP